MSCKFFVTTGDCRFGSRCKFSHDRNVPSSSELKLPSNQRKICPWFMVGTCKFGDGCYNLHKSASAHDPQSRIDEILGSRASAEPAAAAESTTETFSCCICMDNVSTFALLVGCDHLFCMECIHKWRAESAASATSQSIKSKRSCPICRAHSDFVISSPVFVTGEAKKELIKARLSLRSSIPCKEFSSTKLCKFGGHCFYAHLDADGSDLKPQQLRERSRASSRRMRVDMLGVYMDIIREMGLDLSLLEDDYEGWDSDEDDLFPGELDQDYVDALMDY